MIGTSGFIGTKKEWNYTASYSGYGPNCLEVNSSFYRMPSKTLLSSLFTLPSKPQFVFKVHRSITHFKRLRSVEEEWDAFYNSIKILLENKRIGCILFQMPPTFVKSKDNIKNLHLMASHVGDSVRCAIEFRHCSWLCEEVYGICAHLNWCVVGTFINKRITNNKWMGTMPCGLFVAPRTTDITYIRVHGKQKFKGALTSIQMKSIIDVLSKRKGDSHFVIFNNVFYDNRNKHEVRMPRLRYAALSDAMRMMTRYRKI